MAAFYRALVGCVFCLLAFTGTVKATHLLGAQLSYYSDTTANPNPLRYFFKLVTYSDASSVADNPQATLVLGDGIELTSDRTSKILIYRNCKAVYASTYYFAYTFPAGGLYTAVYYEPNRTKSNNIFESDLQVFAITATIDVDLFEPLRNEIRYMTAPYPCALLNQPFRQSVAAYNPTGDSLTYALITPLTLKNKPGTILNVTGYQLPGQVSLNAQTGELVWAKPGQLGSYTFAVRTSRYRNKRLIGSAVRDFIVTVTLPENITQTFTIENRTDLSITDQNQVTFTVGQALELKVKYQTSGSAKRLTAYSDLFYLNQNYTLDTVSAPGSITATFNITPQESWRRSQPYTLVFRGLAFSDGTFAAQDFTVTFIAKPATINGNNPDLPGEQEPGTGQLFVVYPNPASGYFLVKNVGHLPQTHLQLYNTQQQLIRQEPLLLKNTRIRLPNVAAGLYFYQILFENQKLLQSGKLQIQ